MITLNTYPTTAEIGELAVTILRFAYTLFAINICIPSEANPARIPNPATIPPVNEIFEVILEL